MLEREGIGGIEKDEEVFDDIYAYIRNAYDPEETQAINQFPQSTRESQSNTGHFTCLLIIYFLPCLDAIFLTFFSRSERFPSSLSMWIEMRRCRAVIITKILALTVDFFIAVFSISLFYFK